MLPHSSDLEKERVTWKFDNKTKQSDFLEEKLFKMAQAQPHPQHPHNVNRPNPLGPYSDNRKHSEPER